MKKSILTFIMLLGMTAVNAQVKVTEPEFINTYCILTSDSTYERLPKENGTIGKHQNKVGKFAKIASKVGDIAAAGGAVITGTSSSLGGALTGLRTMTTAHGVSSAADAVSGLAGSSGMDIIFAGGKSSYSVAGGSDVRLVIKGENNNTDPVDCYRIVRFKASKKERRIQWMEFESSLLGSSETKKGGYISFTGNKYGEQSYLITIPSSELESGEYGIFYMSIISATAIPVGTFSVK